MLPFSNRSRRRAGSDRRGRAPALRLECLESRDTPGVWTPLTRLTPSTSGGAQAMMLLSDGTVMIQGGSDVQTASWYRLTPDAGGSYVNGTFSTLASMGTSRLFFASNVLTSGKVLVLGGEYSGSGGNPTFTNTGEIYDPVANTWAAIPNFPQSSFGDDPTEMLPDGRVLAGYISGPQTYIYNPTSNSWSQTGTKLRNDRSDEETWVKLPDDSVLSYDIFSSIGQSAGHAQRYVPSTGKWVDAGTVPVALSSNSLGDELGPAFLLPDGRVFQIGANSNTALYTPATNTWAAGPVTPNGKGADDAPGAVLPNGHVIYLADTTPPIGTAPTQIFDFDPVANAVTQQTPANTTFPPTLTTLLNNNGAFLDRMLVLPNGDVLMSTSSRQLWEYTPDGGPNDAWRPAVSAVAYTGGQTYTLTGTQLNGLSEGANYGDDAEMSSNYPIVRLTTTDGTNKVYYARTFNWSSTGVATGSTPVTTQFTLPANLPAGTYSLQVVANGIASAAVSFAPPVYADTHWAGLSDGTPVADVDPAVAGNQPGTVGVNAFATVTAALAAAPAAGGTVVVNGDDGTGTGTFAEDVNVAKAVTLFLQQGPVSFGSLAGTAAANVVLNGVTLTAGGDGAGTEYDGTVTGSGRLTKAGTGALTMGGIDGYTGATAVNGGTFLVTGALANTGGVSVAAGATLGGTGAVAAPVAVAGTLDAGVAGPGRLATGSLSFPSGGALAVQVNGATAGAGYDQVQVTGSVDLTGATLAVTPGATASALGTQFVIVDNDGTSDAVTGTFAGLPEGATFQAGGRYFTISYRGGDGNDVVLTATAPPTVAAVQVADGSPQRSVVRSLTVTFSGPVTFAGGDPTAAFQLARTGPTGPTGTVTLTPTVTADAQGRTVVTLTFSGPLTEANTAAGANPSLIDGLYTLTVSGSQVTGANGLSLDGDGDGVPGGNAVVTFHRLFGDFNGDRTVDPADLFPALQNAIFTSVGQPGYTPAFDFDGNGVIDPADLFPYLQQRLFTSI